MAKEKKKRKLEDTKKGNGLERVTRKKTKNEGVFVTSRHMLCWSVSTDTNSRVQDRNHSTKVRKQSRL